MAPKALRLCLAAAAAAALRLPSAAGLELRVGVHYPEKGSALETCGFQLRVAVPSADEEHSPVAERAGPDYFEATLTLPDTLLHTKVSVAALADLGDGSLFDNPNCSSKCKGLGPQGNLVMQGPYARTEPLAPQNKMEIWPSFCLLSGDWGEKTATFHSAAIGREIKVVARLPSAVVENPTPRPTKLLPPVMFRFNAEWYWPQPQMEYTTWHDLMINGMMEPVAIAEIYVDGVNWTEWDNQPIFSTQDLTAKCTCAPELQFICNSWKNGGGAASYAGGDHHFGKAAAFYDELYDQALPQILRGLPARSAGTAEDLRLGTWGYCIGGLAAWNALTYRPGRFNFAYLGSPAMDFDCGAPFEAVPNLSWTGAGRRPKVYIDAGAAEGTLMNRQTLMLMRKLQERGAVEGSDVFYERLEFGTHQGRSLLRRGLRGLLVLFGSGGVSGFSGAAVAYTPAAVAYTPALEQASVVGFLEEPAGPSLLLVALSLLTAALVGFGLALIFVKRRGGLGGKSCGESSRPLL